MRRCMLMFMLMFFTTVQAEATIYKWVDENGVVTFKDTPPPKGVVAEEVELDPNFVIPADQAGQSAASSSDTPSNKKNKIRSNNLTGSRQPAHTTIPRNFPPVEIYTTSWCPACKAAKKYLRSLDVPFRDYDVERSSSAARKLRQLNPRGGVPTTLIGSKKIIGFNAQAFNRALGIR